MVLSVLLSDVRSKSDSHVQYPATLANYLRGPPRVSKKTHSPTNISMLVHGSAHKKRPTPDSRILLNLTIHFSMLSLVASPKCPLCSIISRIEIIAHAFILSSFFC